MKKVILIMGHLASGKSSIAKRLLEDLNISTISKDDVKEILSDHIGYNNREENLKLSKATFHLLAHSISCLKDEDAIILESNFKNDELKMLKENYKNIQFLSLFLSGNPVVLYDRYFKRQPSRHIAHKSTKNMNFDDFIDSMYPYEQENMLGQSFYFDTTNMEEAYNQIKSKIQSFL